MSYVVLIADSSSELANKLRDPLAASGISLVWVGSLQALKENMWSSQASVVVSRFEGEFSKLKIFEFVSKVRPTPLVDATDDVAETVARVVNTLRVGNVRRDLGDEAFCKVAIDDLLVGTRVQYDLYVRVSERKYVKVAREGEDVASERLSAYKSKDVRFLYMLKDDFKRYVGLNLGLTTSVVKNEKIGPERKLALMKTTGELLSQQLHFNGVNEEIYENAAVFVETVVSVMTEQMDAQKLLLMLNEHADFVYAHSLGVSLYAVMLARVVKWTSPVSLYKVAAGGLLHDIGKKEISREILLKPRLSLTAAEATLLDSHPLRGRDILSQLPSIPTDIVQIVLQHHEDCAGQGYPYGLKKERIHALARMVSVANRFCNFVLKNPNNEKGMAPREAIEKMLKLHEHSLDPAFLNALCLIFGVSRAENKSAA